MGDDSVGLLAVEEMARFEWPDSVRLVRAAACTPDILPAPAEVGPDEPLDIILVDAVSEGRAPGTVSVTVLQWPPPEHGSDRRCSDAFVSPISMHGFSIHNLLSVLSLVGPMPRSLTLIGVEPGSTGPGEGLSPEVQRSRARLVEVLRRTILQHLSS
jgi:hydrogenase maturation protease